MQKKLARQVVVDIAQALDDNRLLQRFSLSKKAVAALLRGSGLAEGIERLFPIQGRLACKEILALCEEALLRLRQPPGEGWLSFSYRYAVNLMFPDPAFDTRAVRFGDGAQFLLAVMQVLFDYERQALPFDPVYDFAFLSEKEIAGCERAAQYRRFLKAFRQDFIYEAMRLGNEVTPYHTLEHITGVHYAATTAARGLLAAGVAVDLALVSGAAAGHDLGKFGCKPNERVPYLHYHYTARWFAARQMEEIGHIAANHSTWDLEPENLSAESLLLIYADFRVKQSRAADGEKITRFLSLEESFEVILQMLDNVDDRKRRRYEFVYSKLHDFEEYMRHLGVDLSLSHAPLSPVPKKDSALMNAGEAVQSLVFLSVEHNLGVMHRLGQERQFGNILEAARSEKDWTRLRAYINIFEQYSTYLSANQKVQTLGFLYELLIHREGDIRRQAASLIGSIIARFNEGYRKEIPTGAEPHPDEQTPFALWVQFLDMVIHPDHRLTSLHRGWLGYTLKIVVDSLLAHCRESDTQQYLSAFLRYVDAPCLLDDDAAFVLLDSMLYLPLSLCGPEALDAMTAFAREFSQRDSLRLCTAALRFLKRLTEILPPSHACCLSAGDTAAQARCEGNVTLVFLQCCILRNLGREVGEHNRLLYGQDLVSDIFLENLKTATPWVLKAVNIELLVDQIEQGKRDHILHISAHLSNLLKVSERVVLRHNAGQALLKIMPLLSLDQRNEIAVELAKGLEVGGDELSKYIPQYLGELALYLHPSELDELIANLDALAGSVNDRIASVALDTVGSLLECYPAYRGRFEESSGAYSIRRERLLGMLFGGLASYRETVRQQALLVIGQVLYGSKRLALEEKASLFSLCCKKFLFLISEHRDGELTFYFRAAALSHLYGFLALHRLEHGEFPVEQPGAVAFFPGSFDPFTLSHKGIVHAIRALGFEVYLAVDEFSWSKKTQPGLIRRQIVNMSVADEFSVHLFPHEIPVNLANPADLQRLRGVFAGRELYVVVGSDVIESASCYRCEPSPDSIHAMNHIIFQRSGLTEEDGRHAGGLSLISGKVIELQLPTHLEDISSTRIRENIDLNRDISNLIAPTAQDFIYQNGLYLREPQYKPILRASALRFEYVEHPQEELLSEMAQALSRENSDADARCGAIARAGDAVLLLRHAEHGHIIGFASLQQIGPAALYFALHNAAAADFVRRSAAGNILLLTGVERCGADPSHDAVQLLLTEALALSLANDCGFAIFFSPEGDCPQELCEALERQGFVRAPCPDPSVLYVADMRSPVVLIHNLETTIKEPFSSNERVLLAIGRAHRRLQTAMTRLYPGNLVLSLNAGVIHHRLVEKVTALNGVPNFPTQPRILGDFMCVPFGKILRGNAVPNTVTKTLHTDKVFTSDIKYSAIEAFPYYPPLESQLRNIRSFHRPVILVDDLLHGGDRLMALDPMLEREEIDVQMVLVGLLSGRGRDLMAIHNRPVDSVYYVPNLRQWFVESTLYPFIGGDTVRRANMPVPGLLPSVNMILPYAYPSRYNEFQRQAVFEMSRCCIENARDILLTLEAQYRAHFARNLTLSRLSEAIILPLCPDKGSCMSYDPNLAASVYLESDLEMLLRTRDRME